MAYYCSECTYLNLDSKDIYGKFWCEKRLERHMANELECNRFCKAYSRDENVSKSAYQYSVEHSSDSGCYLTTILCNILNLPDNNVYLNTMRNFRNSFLQNDETYKPILVEYDIIGPKLAESLNNDPLKKTIAIKYFNKYILPITNLINENKNEKALNEYIKMTNSLKELYGFNCLSPSKIEIENADIKQSGHGIYKVKKITSV